MPEPRLISIGSNIGLPAKLVFYFLASIIGLALIGALSRRESITVIVAFSVLLIFILSPLLLDFLQIRRASRAATVLKKLIEDIEEKRIRFTSPLKARPIIFESVGWKDSSHRYYFRARIVPKGDYKIGRVHTFSELSYGIVVNRGEGAVSLPGLEFNEPGLHGVILLYIPYKHLLIEPAILNLEGPMGCNVFIRLYEGERLQGEATLVGCEKALLYLTARLLGARKELKLADLESGRPIHFYTQLSLSQPILVAAHKRSSPRAIVSRLGKIIIAGDLPQYSLVVEFRKTLGKIRVESELNIH